MWERSVLFPPWAFDVSQPHSRPVCLCVCVCVCVCVCGCVCVGVYEDQGLEENFLFGSSLFSFERMTFLSCFTFWQEVDPGQKWLKQGERITARELQRFFGSLEFDIVSNISEKLFNKNELLSDWRVGSWHVYLALIERFERGLINCICNC